MSLNGNGSASNAPIILVSPDMRPSVMGVARSLAGAGLLERFVTTLAFDSSSFGVSGQIIGKKLQRFVRTRSVPSYLKVPVETFGRGEITRILASRLLSDITCSHVWEWSETDFDRRVADRWAGKAPVIYGCENASVDTFVRQRARGGRTILWQVIAHPQTMDKLIREEYETFPDAITPYVRHLFQINERVNERKNKQYANADLIVTNSMFSRQTFIDAGFTADQVVGIPTGCPPIQEEESPDSGPMIFLCAGTQSIRKGIQYLLETWRKLRPGKNAELWLVGKMELPQRLLENLHDNVIIKPSVSKPELKEMFRQASYLVLPTLCEGLAHIVLEAMSAGRGIITTENSGCGDLVEDGVNGWKVPIRNVDALADKINWCLENPKARIEMGGNSLKKAAAWQEEDFANTHLNVIRKFLNQEPVPSKALQN